MQCSAVQCSAMQCNAAQCSAAHSAVLYWTIPYHTLPYHTVLHHTTRYGTVHHNTIHKAFMCHFKNGLSTCKQTVILQLKTTFMKYNNTKFSSEIDFFPLRGYCTSYCQSSMRCALSQNYQLFFEKKNMHLKVHCPRNSKIGS